MEESRNQMHKERDRPKKAGLIKVRFVIAVLAILCPVVCYISRQNLSFAIVSMVEDEQESSAQIENHIDVISPQSPTDTILGKDSGLLNVINSTALQNQQPFNKTFTKTESQKNGSDSSQSRQGATCKLSNGFSSAFDNDKSSVPTKGYGPKYKWSADDRGLLLGAFFYTYVICQIPGARLAELVGSKWILTAAGLGSAVLSLVSPLAASTHVHLFSFVRILMGVFQSAIYPTCYVLYSYWLPPLERSQALPILGVSAYVGSIVASSLTGYFSEQVHMGWEWAFYAPGFMCAIWTLLWVLVAADEPRKHSSISIEELVYIESRIERDLITSAGGQRRDISWRKMFTSRSIWAMMAGFFASNWSFTVVLLLIPTYLNRILDVSPMNNGIINSIIYILYCVASPLVGAVSAIMVQRRLLSRLNIRKLFQGIALISQAICFILLPLMGCQQAHVFTVLFIQIVLFSFVNGGEVQLPTELSVDFSGTIYAIGNCVGSSTGFIVPYIYSQIVREETNRDQWHTYFYIGALISAIGGIIFVIFGQNRHEDFSKDVCESRLNICKLTGTKSSMVINLEKDCRGCESGHSGKKKISGADIKVKKYESTASWGNGKPSTITMTDEN